MHFNIRTNGLVRRMKATLSTRNAVRISCSHLSQRRRTRLSTFPWAPGTTSLKTGRHSSTASQAISRRCELGQNSA